MSDTAAFPRVCVIIPALNEAESPPHVLPRVAEAASAVSLEVILVDGHSTDNTIAVAQRLLPHIRVIKQTVDAYRHVRTCAHDAVPKNTYSNARREMSHFERVSRDGWVLRLAGGTGFHTVNLPRSNHPNAPEH